MATPSSVELVCVDPAQIRQVWPHVKQMIERAILRTGLNHTADIEDAVLRGDGLLWLVWDGAQVLAAVTTALIQTDSAKVCVITACTGESRNRWLALLSEIETYARHEGCSCVRIYGRKGWERALDGYGVKNVILERAL